jgi:hypothetical protein
LEGAFAIIGFEAGLDAGVDTGFLAAVLGVLVAVDFRSTILGAALSSVGLEAAGLGALLSGIVYPR